MNTSESASPQVQSSIMTHRLYKEHLNHFKHNSVSTQKHDFGLHVQVSLTTALILMYTQIVPVSMNL